MQASSMLEILVAAIVGLALLAKRRPQGRRWTANMQNVNTFSFLALGSLLSVTLVKADLLPSGDNEFRLLSIKGLWALRDLAPTEGPIMIGVSHSDYSITEIEEFLENETQLTRGDLVATREIAKRLIRRVGIFAGSSSEETLNDGKPLKVRLNWPMSEGSTLAFWAYNMSGSQLSTGAEAVFTGQLTIVWT